MKEIINKGQVLSLVIYSFYGVAIILGALFDKTGFNPVFLITFLFWLITLVSMMIIRMSKLRHSVVYERIYIISVGILAVFLQLCFTSIFIVFIVDAVLWLIIITFLNKKCFHLAIAVQTVCVIVLLLMPRELSGIKDYNVVSLIFTIIGFLLADRVGTVIIDILHQLEAETREQERSLDDMLEIVESKHNRIREISAAKSGFLANMSHELRTPLNAVIGYNDLILQKGQDTEVAAYARNVKSSGTMMLSLVNDILDLSKIESNKMTLVPIDFSLKELINDITAMIEPKTREKELAFVVNADESVLTYYRGDDIRLKQILVNLLTNAVKYTSAGTVTFSVLGTMDETCGHLHFSVKDTGMGIKEEDLSKLNEKYVRIDEERNRNIEGTGLGISIVTNFLRLMGSKLHVESTYGAGSEFSFDLTLPLLGEEQKAIQVQEESSLQEIFTAPDMNILVVDDTPMNLKVITALLKKSEVKVDTAINGADAIKMATQKKYDVIFLDRFMPQMDGVETLKQMKDIENFINADTPVVALTADATLGSQDGFGELGFDDYLAKPIALPKLVMLLRRYGGGK